MFETKVSMSFWKDYVLLKQSMQILSLYFIYHNPTNRLYYVHVKKICTNIKRGSFFIRVIQSGITKMKSPTGG